MISINLLPTDAALKQKQQSKFRTIQFISTGVLVLLIFLASITVGLRVLQAQNIKQGQTQVEAAETNIEAQKDKESGVLVLKSRLDVINQYLDKVSKQVSNYNYISKKSTGSIDISSVSVDRFGNILLSAAAPDSKSLDQFIEQLLNKESAEVFTSVEVESLSRSRDATYRASLKLVSK